MLGGGCAFAVRGGQRPDGSCLDDCRSGQTAGPPRALASRLRRANKASAATRRMRVPAPWPPVMRTRRSTHPQPRQRRVSPPRSSCSAGAAWIPSGDVETAQGGERHHHAGPQDRRGRVPRMWNPARADHRPADSAVNTAELQWPPPGRPTRAHGVTLRARRRGATARREHDGVRRQSSCRPSAVGQVAAPRVHRHPGHLECPALPVVRADRHQGEDLALGPRGHGPG